MRGLLGFSPAVRLAGVAFAGELGREEAAISGGSLGGALFERQLKLRSLLCSCFEEFVLQSTSCTSCYQIPLLERLTNMEL